MTWGTWRRKKAEEMVAKLRLFWFCFHDYSLRHQCSPYNSGHSSFLKYLSSSGGIYDLFTVSDGQRLADLAQIMFKNWIIWFPYLIDLWNTVIVTNRRAALFGTSRDCEPTRFSGLHCSHWNLLDHVECSLIKHQGCFMMASIVLLQFILHRGLISVGIHRLQWLSLDFLDLEIDYSPLTHCAMRFSTGPTIRA
jgi:hypothetical protein